MAPRRLIAIASLDDRAMDGEASAHFGRCPFYTLVTIEGGEVALVRVVPNPHAVRHIPGVMPRFIYEHGAQVIIAGGMGPRAIRMFEDLGVEVVTGVTGRVGALVSAYLDGEIGGVVPCVHDHPDSCGGHGASHV